MICTVKKVRRLPAQGRILVGLGDRVAPDTPVGKLDYVPGQLTKYPLAEELRIAPEHLQKAMLKSIGDWIDEDEPLAAIDEFHIQRTVRSPGPGYIGLVSRFLGDVFIRSPLPTGPKEPVTVSAKEFGLSTLAFSGNIAVNVNDRVERGQELVIDPFRAKSRVVSPVFGIVTEISRLAGTITIKPIYQATEVSAHISGTVTALTAGESVEISTPANLIQGILGYGGERVGRLLPLADTGRDLDTGELPSELAGTVVVARRGATAAALTQLAANGAVGVVLGSCRYNQLREFLGGDPLRVTGHTADTPLTVILMQGFGDLPMADEPFAELSALAGRTASIDGSTQLRAGVLRTEVVRSEAVAAAKAWLPVLTGINDRWQERVPDWRRVFPGLVALLGVQTFLWPEWRRLLRESGRGDASTPPFYVAPPSAAGPVWRFAYTPLNPTVAWAFVGAPGTAPWDHTLATLGTQDVSWTLSTLTDGGRVVTYGQAPAKLMTLQGTMGKGDQPLALPICDCQAMSEMLPEWRLGVENVLPILSRTMRRLFEEDPTADADLAFADLFWGVWGELLRAGCITVGVTDERHGLARLLGRPQPHAFVGVLILRGDHYALWEKISQTA